MYAFQISESSYSPVNFFRPCPHCCGHANRSESSQIELSLTRQDAANANPKFVLLDSVKERKHRGILCKKNMSVLCGMLAKRVEFDLTDVNSVLFPFPQPKFE
jgi:hypothetical protein